MKRQAFGIFTLLLIASVFCLCLKVQLGRSNSSTITVPNDYRTIQEAINHANSGDTIFVKAGTYIGHIDVNKSITLKGESSQNTTLKVEELGEGEIGGIHILASNVTISGFKIISEEYPWHLSGYVMIDGTYGPSDNNVITDNIIVTKRSCPILVFFSTGTRISDNLVIWPPMDADYQGICVAVQCSHFCVVDNNTVDGGQVGIWCDHSDNILVSNNLVTNQVFVYYTGAIALTGSPNTTVIRNTVVNNEVGILLHWQTGDRIYHNNFIHNSRQVVLWDFPSVASWDDGYPLGGNYWSDYNRTDVYCGRWQNETGSDGIGDAPYVIGSGNQDNYPLMDPYWNPADVNRDMRIDIKDVVAVSKALGSCPGDPKWNPLCDVNGDLIIDIKDFYIVCKNYGKTYPSNT